MANPIIVQYRRVSSKSQIDGTGLEQQSDTNILRKLSGEHKLPISDKVYEDIAVSSFKSKNFTEGDLGRLVNDCQSGLIPPRSIVVMFSLDRLSRDDVNIGQEILLRIINSGVRLFTVTDGVLFDKEDGTAMMGQLIISCAFLARANEESKVKSKRTVGNALSLIKRFQTGDRSTAGYPIAIESVGRTVWWCDSTNGDIRPDEYYYPVVKQIIKWIIQGYGSSKIVDFLNESYDAPISNRQKKINHALMESGEIIKPTRWSITSIRKLHTNRALLGERTMNLQGESYKLDHYYPAVLSEKEYYQLQAIRDKRVPKSTSRKWLGLVSGIGVTTCHHCGYGMSYVGGNTSPSYICLGAQSKRNNACTKMWSISALHLEDTIVRLCIDKTWIKSDAGGQTSNKDVITSIETRIAETHKQKDNLQTQIEDLLLQRNEIPELFRKMSLKFESQIVDLKKSRDDQIKLSAIVELSDSLSQAWSDVEYSILDKYSIDARTLARELVRKSVSSIKVERIAKGHHRVEVKFVDGVIRTARRQKNSLFIPTDTSFNFPTEVDGDTSFERNLFNWGDGSVTVDYEDYFPYEEITEK
jgi:DNA invertase Pin-like site-specific DNA recombinase